MNVTANELKNHLDQYLDMAETAPVIVEKRGKIRLALISYSVYEQFRKMDDISFIEKTCNYDPDTIDALCGKYKNTLTSSDEFARRKQDEIQIEEEKWQRI